MRILLLIIFSFYFTVVNAQESTAQIAPSAESQALLAQASLKKADFAYQNKNYDEAIKYYLYATTFLTAPDSVTKKTLAVTYKFLAQSYKRIDDKESTVLYYKKTLSVFTDLKDLKNTARTLNTLAEAERKLDNYEASLTHSIEALEIYKQINDTIGQAKALTGAGIIYRYIGSYEKSLIYIRQAHRFYKEKNMFSEMAKTSNQMGLIYTRLKQFEDARSFYQLTIDLPEDQVDPTTLASALRETAVIDINEGDYASAKPLAMKAYQIYQDGNDKRNQSLITRIIANIYRGEENAPQAIFYYKKSLDIATEIGDKLYQAKAQTPLASFLIDSDVEEAISLLKLAVEISTEINSNAQKLYAYRELRRAETVRENYAAALEYAELEIQYNDIIQKEREDQQIVQLKATLYSEKKQMELESLKEKATLDQLELAKKNDEIKLVQQKSIITELQLKNNKYSSMLLGLLLAISIFLILMIYFRFYASKQQNRKLNYLVTRDSLTDCFNRRALLSRMEIDFDDAKTTGKYSVIMVDIDHFKDINDIHGHVAGDSMLCKVAEALKDCVSNNDMVARLGGEEFCIVLLGVSQNKAVEIAEQMRKKVERIDGGDISVTCSFGVTSMEFDVEDPDELISRADIALYQAKALGRNQVRVWTDIAQ
jgi:diguanylate cyclase (GGDEF)-like protein